MYVLYTANNTYMYLFKSHTGVTFETNVPASGARSRTNARPDDRPQGAQPLPMPTPTSPEQHEYAREACSSPEELTCLARNVTLERFVQRVLRLAHMPVAGAPDCHSLCG